jgi:hypothetical protein
MLTPLDRATGGSDFRTLESRIASHFPTATNPKEIKLDRW